MQRRIVLLALSFSLIATCFTMAASSETRSQALFTVWREHHVAEVTALETRLTAAGLANVVPTHQLLRTASSWEACDAEPFAIPPAARWPAVISVLELLRELHNTGIVDQMEVVSGYRDAKLNRCAGGAPGSTHHRTFAIDLVPLDNGHTASQLCDFWQREGQRWNMGLSRYPSGRIHIDTSGYRTWGADHTRRSSWCLGNQRLHHD